MTLEPSSNSPAPIVGVAAGVPFLALPPSVPSLAPLAAIRQRSFPVIVAWHLMDAPRTEAAFAAALPMNELPAWRIYLGVPMCGARMPAGGPDELMRLAMQDAVLHLHEPIATQGAREFPAALAEIVQRLGLGNEPLGPIGVVGGSIGSAIAQLVLLETAPAAGIEVAAAVLISPVTQLQPVVDAVARRFHATYPWHAEARRAADRLDFVARADEIVRANQPAIQLIVGDQDDREGFLEPAQRLRAALSDRYDDPSRVEVVVISGMGHALAQEPGVEAAPQTAHAAAVERHAVAWLRSHLPGCAP